MTIIELQRESHSANLKLIKQNTECFVNIGKILASAG